MASHDRKGKGRCQGCKTARGYSKGKGRPLGIVDSLGLVVAAVVAGERVQLKQASGATTSTWFACYYPYYYYWILTHHHHLHYIPSSTHWSLIPSVCPFSNLSSLLSICYCYCYFTAHPPLTVSHAAVNKATKQHRLCRPSSFFSDSYRKQSRPSSLTNHL